MNEELSEYSLSEIKIGLKKKGEVIDFQVTMMFIRKFIIWFYQSL